MQGRIDRWIELRQKQIIELVSIAQSKFVEMLMRLSRLDRKKLV